MHQTASAVAALNLDTSEHTVCPATQADTGRQDAALLRVLNLHCGVTVTDAAGRIIDVNDNFCDLSGYSREELLGQPHSIVNSGEQTAGFWSEVWRTIANGDHWRGEFSNRAKNGSLHFLDGTIAPFIGDDLYGTRYISVLTDITATKLSEQRLRASEAFLDRTGRTAEIGGWEWDLDSQTIQWSPQINRIHDASLDYRPTIAQCMSFYPPESLPVIEQAIQKAIKNATGWDLELLLVTGRGRTVWVRSVGVVESVDGRAVRVVGSMQDITKRKRVEEQLQETNSRFAIAADSAGIGVWEFDVVGNRLHWDERMYSIYGIAGGARFEPYTTWIGSLLTEDRDRCENEIAAALKGDKEFDTEFRIVRPDGEIRYVKAASRTLHDAAGVATRMTGVNIDVTERRRAELGLLETSSLLRTVLDSATDLSVIATDTNMIITVFNAGAERLLGYTSEDVVDRITLMQVHDPQQLRLRGEEFGAQVGRRFDGAAVLVESARLHQAREWTYLRKDGTQVTVSLVVCAMRHSVTGDLLGYLGLAHDVTLQKLHEESLRDAMHKAESSNRAKSEFLANMSHEIRTPMNAVIGLSYLLARTSLDPAQRDLLSKVRVSSRGLLAVINDVLDLTKIEAGELIVERIVFSISSLAREISDVMASAALAKGIDFKIDVADDLPAALHGDPTRLSQILTNLVSNAIKFTERGSVTLRISLLGVSSAEARLCFVVQDTGIGISPEAQVRLFEPFVQADVSITRRYGGTGLGLSIVKSLTNLLGGEVSMHSTPGVGSEFRVDLSFVVASPADMTQKPQPAAADERGLVGVRILVVDDSDINLEVTKRILELDGAQVGTASNGLEALERLGKGPDEFDVVLMDVQMPILDGHQTTRRIRLELGLVDLPIIALTAGALSSERQRAVAAGMDDFIIKPFDAPTLIRSIVQQLKVAGPRAATLISAFTQRAPTVAFAWPEIDGIDAVDVRSRLRDDFPLFRSSLKRLLDEFSDVVIPSSMDDQKVVADYAARLHKLTGSSGMLGAKAIYRLAVDTRAAWIVGKIEEARHLADALSEKLRCMRESAAGIFDVAPRHSDEQATVLPALEPAQLVELIEMLHTQSLSAMGRFADLSPQLRQHLGGVLFEQVRDQVDNLRFTDAAKALQNTRR